MTGPLAGVTVADFTWVGAGPYATRVLAAHGATVIKIESSSRLDALRLIPPFAGGVPGIERSGYFAERNYNKQSLTLNLTDPQGVELALGVIAKSDVVTNSFSAGTMERLGLGYERAVEVRPDVIYVSMPMQGASGPHRSHIGYGSTIAALIGLLECGGLDGRDPLGTGTNYPDHVANPAHAAFAILAALRHRRRTGRGQYVEIAQTEAPTSAIAPILMESWAHETRHRMVGNADGEGAPRGAFPCLGDDSWCVIDVRNDDQWRRLTDAMELPQLKEDPRFIDSSARLDHADELNRVVATWTSQHTAEDVAGRLQASGVPAAAVETAADVVDKDVQLAHRGHWIYLDHAEMGRTVYSNLPYRLSQTPQMVDRPAPMLGEHTRGIAQQLLGLSDVEITELVEGGVLS